MNVRLVFGTRPEAILYEIGTGRDGTGRQKRGLRSLSESVLSVPEPHHQQTMSFAHSFVVRLTLHSQASLRVAGFDGPGRSAVDTFDDDDDLYNYDPCKIDCLFCIVLSWMV